MKRMLLKAVIAAGLLASSIAVFAHHGLDAYDPDKKILVEGVVAKLDWNNPHVYMYVDRPAGNGTERWVFELSSPNLLVRQGGRRDEIDVGARVEIRAYQAKDGTQRGAAVVVGSWVNCVRFNSQVTTVGFEGAPRLIENCTPTAPFSNYNSTLPAELELSADERKVFTLAEQVFPTLFPGGASFARYQGYIYRYYGISNVYVGVRDGQIFLMGGPFGGVPVNRGSVESVLALLEAQKVKLGL